MRSYKYLIYLVLSFFLISAQSPNKNLDEDDLAITPKLLSNACSGVRGNSPISHLMLHFCSDAYQNPQKPYDLERITGIFEQYKVSAHYLIDREGNIFQLVNENRVAYHAGKGKLKKAPFHQNSLNSRSIGIEIMAVGEREEMKKLIPNSVYDKIDKENIGFTEAQYESLNNLIDDITKRNTKILKNRDHIVGHDEYAPTRRCDPGVLFEWDKIGL